VTAPKPTFFWIVDAALGFCISLALLTAIGTISYREHRDLVRTAGLVSQSEESLEQIRTIFSIIAENERARYAVTQGDASQLQIVLDSAIQLAQHSQRLRQLTQDDPLQQHRMDALQQIIEGENNEWDQLLVARGKTSNLALTARAEMIGSSTDRQRQVLAQMASEENKLLQVRQDSAQTLATRAGNVVIVLVIFTFVFLALSYRGVVKDIRLRRRAEAALCDVQEQLESLLEKERALSRLDPLTGLANRRAFYEVLEAEKQRCMRYQRPFSLAYIDLDNFKRVNDSRGHTVGDFVLTTVAELIRSHVRTTDTVARLGGDEFAILLPETDPNGVKQVLSKLHDRLRSELQNAGLDMSLSVGAATFLNPPESVDDIVRTADELMYSVKTHGKNDLRLAIMG
jgi:diguanylate cyclase (GGDEF)-like protein